MMNGINNGIQQTVKQPALLAALAAANPAALAVGVVGVVVFAIFMSGKKGNEKSPPVVEKAPVQQLPNGSTMAKATVQPTVSNGKMDVSDPYESMSEEELQKELIRQAMSELGKRSGAARARKKAGVKCSFMAL